MPAYVKSTLERRLDAGFKGRMSAFVYKRYQELEWFNGRLSVFTRSLTPDVI